MSSADKFDEENLIIKLPDDVAAQVLKTNNILFSLILVIWVV